MDIRENVSLRSFNTFGIDVRARRFAAFTNLEELQQLLEQSEGKEEKGTAHPLILGGGSNLLFTKDVDGWVLKNGIPGITVAGNRDNKVLVRAGAGENWHGFVMHCLSQGWSGMENLSLIPGSVGASPMQNIGAYGVEIASVFEELEAWDLEDRKTVRFNRSDCAFGYRESFFKKEGRNRFVILNVTYCLDTFPTLHMAYGAIGEELEKMGVHSPGPRDISNAVIHIRGAKLPDPKVTGNAGSFFKNPEVTQADFVALSHKHPDVVGYPLSDGGVKLAAGWLIEKAGWKGFRRGDAGCHPKQALVLVNYGGATGNEIWQLSQEILDDVHRKFGVKLDREVNIY
jgi:UDP-N-acetylmuramate dehydrogenase